MDSLHQQTSRKDKWDDQVKEKRFGNKGFTLLEVMIAMAILAVGLLAIAGMQIIAIRANAQSREVTEAITLATRHLDYLKSLPYNDPALDDTEETNNDNLTDTQNVDHSDPNNPINGKYNRIWNVADSTPNPNTKTVMVIVSWLSGPNQISKQVQFPTVISKP